MSHFLAVESKSISSVFENMYIYLLEEAIDVPSKSITNTKSWSTLCCFTCPMPGYPVINVKLCLNNSFFSSLSVFVFRVISKEICEYCKCVGFKQRIRQRKRARGEEAGVLKASEAATD